MTRGWRLAAVVGGLTAIWLAVASPVAHLDHHLLTAHMMQHLLLMLVAAPLLLLAVRNRLGTISAHPAFCWLAGSLTVMVWHVPAVFELALQSPGWHLFEQATFFIAGVLFWLPVVQPSSSPWLVPLYLFLATLPCDALSAYLAFCDHVVYHPYASAHGGFGLSPVEDQALAGALMWVTVTFAYLFPALILTTQLIADEGRHSASFS